MSLLCKWVNAWVCKVSDAQLDQTITSMAGDNKLTLAQFRQSIVEDGLDYEKYRESVRTELISGEVRRNNRTPPNLYLATRSG